LDLLELALQFGALPAIQLDGALAPAPVGPAQERGHRLQVALQFADGGQRRFTLSLRFEEQLGLLQEALPHGRSGVSPGAVQLAGFPAAETVRGERFGQTQAFFGTGARHRHQILHCHLRRERPAAHLLLHAFRQQFHQRQAARYPTGAAIKPARQRLQAITETLFQLRQQPAFFQRRRSFAHAQRTIQHQRFGLAQRPHQGLYRVPPQLLQGRDALVAVDYLVALRLSGHGHDDDRRLLSGGGQRSQQPSLPLRSPRPQLLSAPLQLVKLQSHRGLSRCSFV
jgi:hypothetical protein